MAQEGRLLAAAIEARDRLDPEDARRILIQLDQRQLARLRVVNSSGEVLADSALLGPRREGDEAAQVPAAPGPPSQTSVLYRIGSLPFRLMRGGAVDSDQSADSDISSDLLTRPEIQSALEGRYGAATRITVGPRRSVTLHIAIPVRIEGAVEGAVLVSQSTGRILQGSGRGPSRRLQGLPPQPRRCGPSQPGGRHHHRPPAWRVSVAVPEIFWIVADGCGAVSSPVRGGTKSATWRGRWPS